MKIYALIICCIISVSVNAQFIDSLNTAKNALYMTAAEREMVYEINRVRHHPTSYLQYLTPLLEEATERLKTTGKGAANYSLTYSSTTINGKETKTIDTTWHYTNEEEVRALTTLINDLKKLKSLSILLPDKGVYNAAKKHAADQQTHEWKLLHTGSDGSSPWDRIKHFSPLMKFGNENIAGRYGYGNNAPREIVLQLLIDGGIPGYGHRYNLLDPQWTYVACRVENYKGTWWWIQEFSVKR